MSEDSKAAEDWSSYEIPTDAQMLAKHNAEENRKNKHLLGILHNMVLDRNYHGTHEANTLRKQCNEQAKALAVVTAKLAEVVTRLVEVEERLDVKDAKLAEVVERVGLLETWKTKASEFMKSVSEFMKGKTREETK